MTRKNPKNPPVVRPDEKAGWIRQVRKYKVITPLYGGGEETQKPDSITVVRATEVRGHLRFWWRATRGGAFNGDLKKMRNAEEKIWGSSSGKDENGKDKSGQSKVRVRVTDGKMGKPMQTIKDKKDKSVDIGDPGSPWGYVAFPLRKQDDKPVGEVLSDVHFDLEIVYPESFADDVESAIWAWETFGGIGARTRRGFGALLCTEVSQVPNKEDISPTPPVSKNVEQLVKKGLKKYVTAGSWPEGVPHLSMNLNLFVTTQKPNPEVAWEMLFNALQNFRQKKARYDRKTGKQSDYGMSRWPEANAIRDIYGLPPKFPTDVPRQVIKKFPRGAFGLPIGFEMHHDKKIKDRPELRGFAHDRLASPLILRPVTCEKGAVGLAVIMEWQPMQGDKPYTPPGGLILKDAPSNPQVFSYLEQTEADLIPPLEHERDVLKAFLKYLRKTGGTKS